MNIRPRRYLSGSPQTPGLLRSGRPPRYQADEPLNLRAPSTTAPRPVATKVCSNYHLCAAQYRTTYGTSRKIRYVRYRHTNIATS